MTKKSKASNIQQIIARKKELSKGIDPSDISKGILTGDKQALSKAITLLESRKKTHIDSGQEILQQLLPYTGKSIRIGITGVPGVGKSTFIESFGNHLISLGHKVAVLAIDPSSEKSGGSILGDKTRMESLSVNENAFIRPTSSSGSLGGVSRKTHETMLLCEAAGFDVILIETVGVGQSETAVHQMTDFFLLLMLAGAGDELQGIKRGIMEMADALVITKADGDNKTKAKSAASAYKMAMHLFPPSLSGWVSKTAICSSIENSGIHEIWDIVEEYVKTTTSNNYFSSNRTNQREYWLREAFKSQLLQSYFDDPAWQKRFDDCLEDVKNGLLTPHAAADKLISFT
ncbi:MAG: methylmalonyl Co-A mutase-associated GTPase MeaB [Crocinitomicaceae bacterium]|nr:methylmalonyl Co-A mutase-associated GTPase MeaB [Crocinitomicaceae bacterium]